MPETTTVQESDALGSFKISSPHLQYTVDAVKRLVNEARFKIEDGLLKVREVDAAHVAIVKGGAPITQHEGDDAELFVPMDAVKKALDPVPLGEVDPLEVRWTKHEVTLCLPGGHEFTYEQADTSGMADPNIPDLDLPNKLEFSSRDYWDAVRRANNIGSDYCKFAFDDKLTMVADSPAGLEHRSTIEVKDHIRTGKATRSLYSTEYLRKFSCADAFQGDVTMELGQDYPTKLRMQPGDASFMFMLAPRIESA